MVGAQRNPSSIRILQWFRCALPILRCTAAFVLNGSLPTNKMRDNWWATFRSAAMNLLHSGYATLQYEIAEERASALGRLGRRLEAALTALAACPRTADSNRNIRDRPRRTGGICALALRRAARGLRSQQDRPRDTGLRGAERGGRPHGAIGQAEHPSDEDHGGRGSAAADVLKVAFRGGSPRRSNSPVSLFPARRRPGPVRAAARVLWECQRWSA